jgi:hypothetical protein
LIAAENEALAPRFLVFAVEVLAAGARAFKAALTFGVRSESALCGAHVILHF